LHKHVRRFDADQWTIAFVLVSALGPDALDELLNRLDLMPYPGWVPAATSNGFPGRFVAARGRLGRTAMKYPAYRSNPTEFSPQQICGRNWVLIAPRFTALRSL
jgi:hypothetical protein